MRSSVFTLTTLLVAFLVPWLVAIGIESYGFRLLPPYVAPLLAESVSSHLSIPMRLWKLAFFNEDLETLTWHDFLAAASGIGIYAALGYLLWSRARRRFQALTGRTD